MTKVTIDPGICSFPIIIHAESDDMQHVKIKMSTGCPNLKNAFKEIEEHDFDAYKEVFGKIENSDTLKIISKNIPHPACPVFSGMLKAIEAETGLALPRDCSIKIEKE